MFRMYYVYAQRIYLLTAFGTFLTVPVLSYLALHNLTLAFVYMSTSLVHVLILIMSHVFLDERLSKNHYISITLIIVGIIIYNC